MDDLDSHQNTCNAGNDHDDHVQDHVLQRAFTVEPMQALAASADGMYVAGGGSSGTIYIWAAGSGQLLRSWPAHYKVCSSSSSITCLLMRCCNPGECTHLSCIVIIMNDMLQVKFVAVYTTRSAAAHRLHACKWAFAALAASAAGIYVVRSGSSGRCGTHSACQQLVEFWSTQPCRLF